jgi:hypothetical protein
MADWADERAEYNIDLMRRATRATAAELLALLEVFTADAKAINRVLQETQRG